MIRQFLVRFLKVPREPQVPPGSHLVKTFRAARNFFTYQQLRWTLGQLAALAGLLFTSRLVQLSRAADERLFRILFIGEVLGWITYVFQIPLTWLVLRIGYEMRWYIVTDRSLRIREGVIRVSEKTMTFANIQNMTVKQGPIQRLLKIADLEVRTAGGGAVRAVKQGQQVTPREDLHLAYFRGVDNASEIRDLVRDRLKLHRDSGLGDPDEPHAFAPPAAPLEAARELLAEIRSLRAALSRWPVR